MENLINFVFFLSPIWLFFLIKYLIGLKSKKEYLNSTYYKITNNSYRLVNNDIGMLGEYHIYKKLKSFEDKGCKFLFNLYIPKNKYDTTEIDVLLITSMGLFVFESKNYSGWIFGSESSRYWTQSLPSGRNSQKKQFYNPIMQNKTHIKYLKNIVGNVLPIYSIIVFSERCTLMDISLTGSNVEIIKRSHVFHVVNEYYNNFKTDVLSEFQISEVYNLLYPYTQISSEIKEKHIENIESNIINNKN